MNEKMMMKKKRANLDRIYRCHWGKQTPFPTHRYFLMSCTHLCFVLVNHQFITEKIKPNRSWLIETLPPHCFRMMRNIHKIEDCFVLHNHFLPVLWSTFVWYLIYWLIIIIIIKRKKKTNCAFIRFVRFICD